MAFPSSYSAFFPKAGSGRGRDSTGAAGPIPIDHRHSQHTQSNELVGENLTDYPLFSSRRSLNGMSPPFSEAAQGAASGKGASRTFEQPYASTMPTPPMSSNLQPNFAPSMRRPSFLASPGRSIAHGRDDFNGDDGVEQEDERQRERLRLDSENGEGDDDLVDGPGDSGSASPSSRQQRALAGGRQRDPWADTVADDADADIDMDMMDDADDEDHAARPQPASGLLSGSMSLSAARYAQAPTSHLSRISSHLPLQMRARSLSQSTSMSGTTYSPPWPNSPPRSGSVASTGAMLYPQQQAHTSQQHLQLARMTSEQNQAIQASATSANSAMFMLPTPYRGHQSDNDLLVTNGYEEAIDEDDEELSDQDDAEGQPAVRSFNPLNPTQLRSAPSSSTMGRTNSTSGMNEGMSADPTGQYSTFSTRPSSRSSASQDVMQAVENVSAPQSQASEYKAGTPMERSASVESYAAGLRSARSSPALAGMGGPGTTADYSDNAKPLLRDFAAPEHPIVPSTPPPVHATLYGSERSNTTGDQARPPTVPFSQQPLRRSQSASHRLRGFSHFATLANQGQGRGSGSSAVYNASEGTGSNVPHTAPVDGSFRIIRANSFSGLSNYAIRAARQQPASGPALGGMEEDSEGTAGASTFGAHGFGFGSGISSKGKGRQSSASSGSDSNHIRGQPMASSSGSGSGSGQQQQIGQSQSRVVKRAVNHKKGSLMPKSKDHLRTLTQLKMESGEFEVASEAALHRLSQSTPAMPPFSTPRPRAIAGALASSSIGSAQASAAGLASNALSTSPFSHTLSPHASPGGPVQLVDGSSHSRRHRPSSSGGQRPIIPFPTKNRFPESAVVDDEDGGEADSSGSDDADYAAASASGNEAGADTDDANSTAGMDSRAWALRDPALHRRDRPGMDMDLSPSSALGWATASSTARPGKRKMTDTDRFEVYNSAFKRRAVSPGSTSSVSLSPLLTNANLREVPALPPGGGLSALGPAAQIPQSPSMAPGTTIQGTSWFYPGSRSRASSPAPSMSSSAGTTRRWGGPMTDEERERSKVDLGKMSLG